MEHSKNTSVTSRGCTSSDISTHCSWRVLDGGATYRSLFNHSRCIYVRHAAVLSRAVPTCSDTRAAVGLNRSFVTCRRSFGWKRNLDEHKKKVQCGAPPQPGPVPKRRMIAASLDEDPIFAPPAGEVYDELSRDLQECVLETWSSIRTHVVHGPIQTRYNRRLTSLNTRDLHVLFEQQTTKFRINLSYGFILKQKQSGRFKYYHSSGNCVGRYLEAPSLIENRADFDQFLERIHESDILQWAIARRPNSDWVYELVTNVTFFVNRIVHHPIGCVGIILTNYVKNNKAIIGLEKDHYRHATYNDNLCLFRCLALHLKREVDALYAEYTDTPVHAFVGVTLDEIDKVETKFKTNVFVYKLVEIADGKTTAELVRRSMGHFADTMNVNLHETVATTLVAMQFPRLFPERITSLTTI